MFTLGRLTTIILVLLSTVAAHAEASSDGVFLSLPDEDETEIQTIPPIGIYFECTSNCTGDINYYAMSAYTGGGCTTYTGGVNWGSANNNSGNTFPLPGLNKGFGLSQAGIATVLNSTSVTGIRSSDMESNGSPYETYVNYNYFSTCLPVTCTSSPNLCHITGSGVGTNGNPITLHF